MQRLARSFGGLRQDHDRSCCSREYLSLVGESALDHEEPHDRGTEWAAPIAQRARNASPTTPANSATTASRALPIAFAIEAGASSTIGSSALKVRSTRRRCSASVSETPSEREATCAGARTSSNDRTSTRSVAASGASVRRMPGVSASALSSARSTKLAGNSLQRRCAYSPYSTD